MAGEFAKFAGEFSIAESVEGVTPIRLEEYGAAELAVEEALRGNFTLLAERQRTARVLFPIERTITADILEKKLRKPNHRPADPGTSHKTWLLAFAVNELMREGEPEKAAVSRVAQAAQTSISTVCKATEAYPWSVAPWK